VATAVGGVPALVGGAGLLVEPGDADAAVEQLMRISGDEQLRRELAAYGLESAREHTLESETARLAAFLLGSASS
jgi:glycosyltransferase involved in cell wall biosynthesis